MDRFLSNIQLQPHWHIWALAQLTVFIAFQNLLLCGNSSSIVVKEIGSEFPVESHANHHQIIATTASPVMTSDLKRCENCSIGRNGKQCSGDEHGECDCTSETVICRCKDNWIGDSCQYKLSKVNCEKLRSCILCRVHKTGPLADSRDCNFYCDRSYPIPLVVKHLHFQDDEHLCSFIHDQNPVDSNCRYFFKYGKLKSDGNLDSSNFYIVAQQDMECGKSVKFPQLKSNRTSKSFQTFAKNYEAAVKSSDAGEENRKASFVTIVIIFVFIALPFVACVFALIYNFSNLPCGLCNVFRQSSSKYLRNVRPFPGFVPQEQSTPL